MLVTMGEEGSEIRIKTFFKGDVVIAYITPSTDYDGLKKEVREICKFHPDREFTMKWIDEEGDPCIISSQEELGEALRLYELNRDPEITIHVFASTQKAPGLLCPGEDKSIYRKGAMVRRKIYKINGHEYKAKRFSRKTFCAFCNDRIWGLGRQGFKCNKCNLMVHKKCHKQFKDKCTDCLVMSGGDRMSPMEAGGELNRHKRPSTGPRQSRNRHQRDEEENGFTPSGQLVGAVGGLNGEMNGDSNQYSLRDFELLRVIGRGSYAKVLMVELKKTKRIYAMKVIKKQLVTEDDDIDWVQTEKHVFETASNHPFLVGLHSCFQTSSRLFFVIEFVKGGDLMFHMQKKSKLHEEHARFYSAEIILALNFLHKNGIIYRDLKLDNVLLDHEGHIKLTDYGMCKEGMVNAGDTTQTFCGTPNYIAPEILRGEDYDYSVDYWALGVLMYEMMAGRSPFDISCNPNNPEQNTEDYLFQYILERTIRIPRTISVRAQSVLKQFLNKDPKERLGCIFVPPADRGNTDFTQVIDRGFTDIQNHPFFKPIDWELLAQKQVTPPYKPRIDSDRDLEHFDPQFTNEPVQLTPDDPKAIEKIDQSEFDGFEYVNPLLMSLEDCV